MIGIVGATGLVGRELQDLLKASKDPYEKNFLCFASQERPAEGVLDLAKSEKQLSLCEFIVNAATDDTAQWLRERLTPEQVLIDNSSAFRMDPEVPLVVPEVNGEMLEASHPVIANPNCTTIILTLGLNALKAWGVSRVIVSTYQAASGAGLKGLEELDAQLKAVGTGAAMPAPQVFPFPLALNVLSHNSGLREEGRIGAGYNEEEYKVIEETRKILGISHLSISATCMRVPVRRAHTEAVTVDLKTEAPLEDVRKAFEEAAGLSFVHEPDKNHFPMPIEAEGKDPVLVGRLRKDVLLPRTFHFLLCGDQLRKGAALNALQILRQVRRGRGSDLAH